MKNEMGKKSMEEERHGKKMSYIKETIKQKWEEANKRKQDRRKKWRRSAKEEIGKKKEDKRKREIRKDELLRVIRDKEDQKNN